MRIRILSLTIFWAAASVSAQTVVKLTGPDESLAERWAKAAREAPASGAWIAYSIDRLMEENSWIGSFRSIPDERDVSLYELVTGTRITMIEARDPTPHRVEKGGDRRWVRKEVALLFEFAGAVSDPASARTMQVTNVSLPVELNGRPLYWLGNVPVEVSVEFLVRNLARSDGRQAERLVQGIGFHGSARAFEVLKGILESHPSGNVREDAAFWISQIDTPAALEVLLKVAIGDESAGVSEKAVCGISQIKDEAATEALIGLARTAPRREIRKKAVFWLAERTSRKAMDAIEEFVERGPDEDVQKQAVFALSQLPGGQGVPHMIRVARTHSNPRIRKQAIFWLGESEDPRAFEAIVAIARGEP